MGFLQTAIGAAKGLGKWAIGLLAVGGGTEVLTNEGDGKGGFVTKLIRGTGEATIKESSGLQTLNTLWDARGAGIAGVTAFFSGGLRTIIEALAQWTGSPMLMRWSQGLHNFGLSQERYIQDLRQESRDQSPIEDGVIQKSTQALGRNINDTFGDDNLVTAATQDITGLDPDTAAGIGAAATTVGLAGTGALAYMGYKAVRGANNPLAAKPGLNATTSVAGNPNFPWNRPATPPPIPATRTFADKLLGTSRFGSAFRLAALAGGAYGAGKLINLGEDGQPDGALENATEMGLGALTAGSISRVAVAGLERGLMGAGTSATIGGKLLGRSRLGAIATVLGATFGAVTSANAGEANPAVGSHDLSDTSLAPYAKSEINVGDTAGNLTREFTTSASWADAALHKGHVFSHGLQSGVLSVGSAPEAIYDTVDGWLGGWLPGDEDFSTSANAIGNFSEEYMISTPEIRDNWDAAVHAVGLASSYAVPLAGALKFAGAGARMASGVSGTAKTMMFVPQ